MASPKVTPLPTAAAPTAPAHALDLESHVRAINSIRAGLVSGLQALAVLSRLGRQIDELRAEGLLDENPDLAALKAPIVGDSQDFEDQVLDFHQAFDWLDQLSRADEVLEAAASAKSRLAAAR
jgi:hypothetical protein